MNRRPGRFAAGVPVVLAMGVAFGVLAAPPPAPADVPRTIHYQGKLTEPDGSPIVGEHTVTLKLYDVGTGGAVLWEEAHAVSLAREDGGIFSVVLGGTMPFGSAVNFNKPLWLSIDVDGQGEFSPRQSLSAVAYAINADFVDGVDSSQLVQLDASGALPAVSGANLTNLNAAHLTSGALPDARLSPNVSLLGSAIDSSEVADGTLTAADTAATFLTAGSGVTVTKGADSWQIDASGAGPSLTGVTAGVGLTGGGTSGMVTLDVGVGTGLVAAPDAISVDVGTAANQVVQLDAAGALPAVSGVNLSGLNAANLASGTVPDARLSTNVSLLGNGIESAEVTDGTLTAADTAATFLTAGSGVTVTKGATSWDISAVGSGGDITSVTAGVGLTGGATSGEAVLNVDVGTAAGKIVQLDASGALPAVSGANLTGLNAGSLSAGTVPDARLSTNVSLLGGSIDSSELADGTIVAADTAAAFLAAGSGVTVTKGATSWQIDATGSGGTVTSITAGAGLTGGTITATGTIALATPVSVANGGTGAATLTAGGLLLGQGASALATTGVLAKGTLVVGDGVTDPALLAVGGNQAILKADATQASGLKWAAGCMPLGGSDSAGRSGTFQMGVFGMSDTNSRLDHLWPAPISGTVTSLYAFVNQAPGAGKSWVVRLRKNAANATLNCTISGTATSCSASGTDTFAAGDRAGAEFTETGNASSTLGSGWSACFIPD